MNAIRAVGPGRRLQRPAWTGAGRHDCSAAGRRRVFSTGGGGGGAFQTTRRWIRYGLPTAAVLTGVVTVVANYPVGSDGRRLFFSAGLADLSSRATGGQLGRGDDDDDDDDEKPYVVHRGNRYHLDGPIPNVLAPERPNPDTIPVGEAALENGGPGETVAEMVKNLILPEWAKMMPLFIAKLQSELSAAPGSLADEIWEEAHNPEVHPETVYDAVVRISADLAEEEVEFLRRRKPFTRAGLAKYLGLAVADIHPDDVPIIAMCGSGGGLRALVAGASSFWSTTTDGLFDCLTYTAGVSGSCWLQALYYSSITGHRLDKLIEHLKQRLDTHIAFPPAAMPLLTVSPTNKYLLAGVWEKARGVATVGGSGGDFGIVDLYGLLLATRLMVPNRGLTVLDDDLKLSRQRRFIEQGEQPLPIYTAVRHEKTDRAGGAFQWFEMTPYEMWCEEWGAGIPTWALGRQFEAGKSVPRPNGLYLPELRLPFLMGVWSSAFCATLSHYYREVRPLLRGLAGFPSVDALVSEHEDEMSLVHPITPASLPNFARGLKDALPTTMPASVDTAETIELMDAGMSNNLPIYPLLRPGRHVDVVIAFDASADVKTDNWLRLVDGYARQRGIRGWPAGAGWPPESESVAETVADFDRAEAAAQSGDDPRAQHGNDSRAKQDGSRSPSAGTSKSDGLSFCNIWIGSLREQTESAETASSRLSAPPVEEDGELMRPDAGICLIYFPFMPNVKVPEADPKTTEFMSTWNFVYTPDQIDTVVALAKANFDQGREQTRRAIRAVYERKKRHRLRREAAVRRAMVAGSVV